MTKKAEHDLAAILRGQPLVHAETGNADRFVASDMVEVVTQCQGCAHMQKLNSTCTAYPEGIPNAILVGDHDHTKTYPGDHGITFQAK